MVYHHGQLTIEYLKSIGYKDEDIITNGYDPNDKYTQWDCKPDIMTTDGKGWEEKWVGKDGIIEFTEAQFLLMDLDVNVLTFNKNYKHFGKEKCDAEHFGCVKLKELLDPENGNNKYQIRVIFRLDGETSLAIKDIVLKSYEKGNRFIKTPEQKKRILDRYNHHDTRSVVLSKIYYRCSCIPEDAPRGGLVEIPTKQAREFIIEENNKCGKKCTMYIHSLYDCNYYMVILKEKNYETIYIPECMLYKFKDICGIKKINNLS